MNPNQALWEKGDFTKIAASMRGSGEDLVRRIGVANGCKGPGSRLRRRHYGSSGRAGRCRRTGRRHRQEPRRGREQSKPRPKGSPT